MDTKLTRAEVEAALAYSSGRTTVLTIGAQVLAALCRHWLATEQDARDAARWRFVKSKWQSGSNTVWHTHNGWSEPALTIACSSSDLDAAIDAALTQKESQT